MIQEEEEEIEAMTPQLTFTNPECVVKVFLVATANLGGLSNSLKSLKKNQFSYEVLGYGTKWQGWRYRMKLYQDAANKTPPKTICILMDAYDAVCIRPYQTKEFLEAFDSYQKPLVIGMESSCGFNCQNISGWWKDKPELKAKTKNLYVNGGLIAGYSEKIAEMFAWMLKDPLITDDQVGLGLYVKSHPDLWFPDVYERILSNKIYGDKIQEDQTCYFAHFPGMSGFQDTAASYKETATKVLGKEYEDVECRAASIVYGVVFGLIVLEIFILFALWARNRIGKSSNVLLKRIGFK